MLATTWVQIIKAVLLMTATVVLSVFVLARSASIRSSCSTRRHAVAGEGRNTSAPGTVPRQPLDTVSLGLALVLGTAGLPHILMRFFTVPDAKAARSSVVWAMALIGAFYVMTTFLGFGARGDPRHRRRGGRPARAATSPRRCWPRSSAAAPARRRRPLPGDHRRGRVRDDPGGGGGPGDLRLRGGGPRRVVEHRAQGRATPSGGGLRGADRGRRHRRDRDPIAVIGGKGLNVSFMVGSPSPWRPAPTSRRCCCVDLAAVQHHRCRHAACS